MATANKKSCDSQLLGEERGPNSKWSLDELTEYAKSEHANILRDEESLAAFYWRLGHALTLAKRHFNHGQWGKHLAEMGIEKTRASRAMAIYRTFPAMKGLKGKSVDDAYKARARIKKRGGALTTDSSSAESENVETAIDDVSTLQTFLTQLGENVEHWVHEAAFVPQDETAELIELVEQAISGLQEMRHSLHEQAKES